MQGFDPSVLAAAMTSPAAKLGAPAKLSAPRSSKKRSHSPDHEPLSQHSSFFIGNPMSVAARTKAARAQLAKDLSLLVAHRGLHAADDSLSRPIENTVPAYLGAWSLGYTHAECDVTVTQDDELLLMHDETLGRLLGPSARAAHPELVDTPVCQVSWGQLQEHATLDLTGSNRVGTAPAHAPSCAGRRPRACPGNGLCDMHRHATLLDGVTRPSS
jgi:hypothetical protein